MSIVVQKSLSIFKIIFYDSHYREILKGNEGVKIFSNFIL